MQQRTFSVAPTSDSKKKLIVQSHIDLISYANKLSSNKEFAKQVNELARLDIATDEIPTEEQTGRTLFHVVLQRKMDLETKKELLEHLFHFLGYSPFYHVIFKSSLVEDILKFPVFNDLLGHIYSLYLIKDFKADFNNELEVCIWKSLLVIPNKAPELFKELLNYRINHGKILQYIECWFNAITIKSDVPDVYKLIVKLANEPLQVYLPYIEKLARCRILTIEYDLAQDPLYQPDKENDDEIRSFLRHNIFSIHPSALTIYDDIRTDQEKHAEKEYQDKITHVEDEINEQLALEPSHHAEFRFKMYR